MRFNESQTNTNANTNSLVMANTNDDMEAKIKEIDLALRNSPEVLQISKNLDVTDSNAILNYGQETAVEISKFSDSILNSIKLSAMEDSGVLLKELAKIMKQFDKKDFEEEKGLIDKIFSNAKKQIDKLMAKYQTLGGEIEKVKVEISKYYNDIQKHNKMLDGLYVENMKYYKELQKYVVAGKMTIEEVEAEDLPYFRDKAQSGGQEDLNNLQNIEMVLDLLRNRVYSLETAQAVSLQTAPRIRLIQNGNYKLMAKINDAFIISIPLFKNAIIEGVTLKKQKMGADAMTALDNATREMFNNNTNNTVEQSKLMAQMGRPAIQASDIVASWEKIMNGIDETKAIEDEIRREQEEGSKIIRLKNMEAQKRLVQRA